MPDTYTTKSGDVWDGITYKMLGSCNYTPLLMDANRAYIGTTIFSAGVVLILPEIDRSSTTKNLPPWRKKR